LSAGATRQELQQKLLQAPHAFDESPLFKYEEQFGQLDGEPYGWLISD
jgi:predicted component of type VI protein secretion system